MECNSMKDLDEILGMAKNVQAELEKAQANLDQMEVEGVSGGGLVKVRATAKGRIVAVDIDQSLLAPSEKQMLEDLVARSEEHTSELQSLMRISYAVFCLKKKTTP